MMPRKLSLLLFALAIVACDSTPSEPDGGDSPVIDESRITRAALLGHLNFLAADSLYGRRAGSQYERRAADYIRDRFIEFGLEPGAPGFFQEFTIPFAVDGQVGLISQNVVGVLGGQGSLAGQWVILGAHYDHLGYDSDPIVVYNGADDNASGTALMMEVASYVSEYVSDAAHTEPNRRSIMFQAYGSEEVGLVGSFRFCDQPTVAMDSVVAMINLDMVGRLKDDVLGLIGLSSSPDWGEALSGTNSESLSLVSVDGLLNRSDQYCFYLAERPVLFLHTGLHAEYHTPLDDVALINAAGMVRVGNLAINLMLGLVHRPDRLAFGTIVPLPVGSAAPDLPLMPVYYGE